MGASTRENTKTEPRKIWCLFSVDNNYGQPNNNLVAWWQDKPSLDVFSNVLAGKPLNALDEANIVGIVTIWAGSGDTFPNGFDTSYRLEDVAEGRNLDAKS